MFARSTLGLLKTFFVAAVFVLACGFVPEARASTQVWSQPPNPAGGQYKSSWYDPDGLDGDEYAYDAFRLNANAAISEIHWRGAYTNYLSGAGKAPVYNFTISIYRSIPGDSQPDVGTGGRLARYNVNGIAGETAVGTFGGVIMYDYAFTLSTPFQAVAGTTYWMQIEASQGVTPTYGWPPDWSMAAGTGGNNSHFRKVTGGQYQFITGDLAFSLYSSDAPTVTISASESPTGSGVITGAGVYPVNSTASLNATANTGWGFVNWTQSGSTVSTNFHYTFTATANRTLVANFAPTYTITTSAMPSYGGTASGGGVYTEGSTVTLTAVANPGFVFAGWSDGCMTETDTFTCAVDEWVTAFFASAPLSATFDFDSAPVHTSLPISLTVDGLTAYFTATGSGYSVQHAGELGINPPGFSGLDLFPNSVFAADLIVDFSQPLVDFSILYSPQELGCDTSATMRATAYLNGTNVGTNTTTAPTPGTWPSGTLTIAVPSGFNRVVVHYDAKPATCQDWGPIFLADNVTVTRQCAPPAILSSPGDLTVNVGDTVNLAVTSQGMGTQTYQWMLNSAPIFDGPTGTGSTISGAGTQTLQIMNVQTSDAGSYSMSFTDSCGSLTSAPAMLTVNVPVVCKPNLMGNGCLGPVDLLQYLNLYFTNYDGHGSAVPGDNQTLPDLNPTSPIYAVPCTPSDPGVYPVIPAAGLKADYDGDCQVGPVDLLGFLHDYFNPLPECFGGCFAKAPASAQPINIVRPKAVGPTKAGVTPERSGTVR